MLHDEMCGSGLSWTCTCLKEKLSCLKQFSKKLKIFIKTLSLGQKFCTICRRKNSHPIVFFCLNSVSVFESLISLAKWTTKATSVLNIFYSICCCPCHWQLQMIFTSQLVMIIFLGKNIPHKGWTQIIFCLVYFNH